MATMAEVMNNPLLYMGLGLMSAGTRRPANQPGNAGAELMNALGQYQQMQSLQAQLAQRQAQETRLGQQFAFEKQRAEAEAAEAERQRAQQEAARQAVQEAMRQNPNAAPGDITRALLQATGDPSMLKYMEDPRPQQMLNVPAGGVVFDPVTQLPVFQNPAVDRQQQGRPQVMLDPGTGVPRLITEGGASSQAIPGFTPKAPKATEQREAEAFDIAPGWTIQTKPLAPKERDALVGDTTRFQTLGANFDRLAQDAAAIMTHPGLKKLSGYRGRVPFTVDPEAFDAQSKLDSLRSQIGLGTLQAMREVSKTGGALGNVSNFEVQRLEQNLAAIKEGMPYESLQSSLQRVVDHAQSTKDRMGTAIETRYGVPKAKTPAQAPAGKAPAGGITQEDIEYTARKHGVSVEEVKRRLGIQ